MQYESERVEYKSQMIDDIYKGVIAFANTDGGILYIGIDDQGNRIGIENVDDLAGHNQLFFTYERFDLVEVQLALMHLDEVRRLRFQAYFLCRGAEAAGVGGSTHRLHGLVQHLVLQQTAFHRQHLVAVCRIDAGGQFSTPAGSKGGDHLIDLIAVAVRFQKPC